MHTHTHTIDKTQQYKITQNGSLQYESPDCYFIKVQRNKVNSYRSQVVEYNLWKLLPYPSICKLLLSTPPSDFKYHEEKIKQTKNKTRNKTKQKTLASRKYIWLLVNSILNFCCQYKEVQIIFPPCTPILNLCGRCIGFQKSN